MTAIELSRAPEIHEFISELDKADKSKRGKAEFHKIANHIHTPQSYDYRLGEKLLSTVSFSEVLEIAIQNEVIPKGEFEEGDFNSEPFASGKEQLAFMILAKVIHDKCIEVVVITDHNTMGGEEKLIAAFGIMNKERCIKVNCKVIRGIEISCADKSHIVGIFDDQKKTISMIDSWLKDNIMTEKSGTICTSINVLNFIHSVGGIGYIAHANTNDLIGKNANFSGAYKENLLNLDFMSLIGITNYSQVEAVDSEVFKHRDTKRRLFHIIDEDSHSYEKLGTNTFWLKGENIDFRTLEEASRDFNRYVHIGDKPKKPDYFIKAFYVKGTGFLKSNDPNNRPFTLSFSERMNSFIGGRGVGKSTVLDVLDLILSQQVYDENKLRFLMSQGSMGVLVSIDQEEYYLIFNSRVDSRENVDIFIEDYAAELESENKNRDRNNSRNARKAMIRKRIQIYKKIDSKHVEELTSTTQLIDKLYTRQFSVNQLVEVASKGHITEFIVDLFNDTKFISPYKFKDVQTIEALKEQYSRLPEIMSSRKDSLRGFIDTFNETEKNQLQLIYDQEDIGKRDFDWRIFFNVYEAYELEKYFKEFDITYGMLIEYLSNIATETDLIRVFFEFDSKNYAWFKSHSIKLYTEKNSMRVTLNSLKSVEENFEKFIDQIEVYFRKNKAMIMHHFNDYLRGFDLFKLQFNINNKVDDRELPMEFHDIQELSMGQKVVAMMDFILAYDEITHDLSPLIIDQPEDNLDNRYIYHNLVQDLIKIKGKRQVLIASHNSTIVVNSGSEKIIVMESDGKQGWVHQEGYLLTKKLSNKIVNILEGGKEAFVKKAGIYNL